MEDNYKNYFSVQEEEVNAAIAQLKKENVKGMSAELLVVVSYTAADQFPRSDWILNSYYQKNMSKNV